MRVSKTDGSQACDLQRNALLVAGVDPQHLYEDQASGRRDDRPSLAACLKALREDDTLLVWKLGRLGRDLRHLINTAHELTGRGIGLKVLTGHGTAIDTTTAASKLVFGIFASLSEFEWELTAGSVERIAYRKQLLLTNATEPHYVEMISLILKL